jgi:hypothetical protein
MKTQALKKLIIVWISSIALSACVYAPVPKFPGIKFPESALEAKTVTNKFATVSETKQAACPEKKPATCTIVALPKKPPKNAKLEIVNGKVVAADKGGLELLDQYMGVYWAIKEQWDALSPSP